MRSFHPTHDITPVVVMLNKSCRSPNRIVSNALLIDDDVRNTERNSGGLSGTALHADLPIAEIIDDRRREQVGIAQLIRIRVVVANIVKAFSIGDVFCVKIHLVQIEIKAVLPVVKILVKASAILQRVSEGARLEPPLID